LKDREDIMLFLDSPATSDASRVTSYGHLSSPDSVTSHTFTEGVVMTSTTPGSPITAQQIQKTIAPLQCMDRFYRASAGEAKHSDILLYHFCLSSVSLSV